MTVLRFLWYCTQCERVWMDCWLSDSFSSLLLNELAEKPAIKGSRARQRCGPERGAEWLAGGGRHGPGKNFEAVRTHFEIKMKIRDYLI